MGNATNDFTKMVDGLVADLLKRGFNSFSDIVCNLPGVYPLEVSESLRRLNRDVIRVDSPSVDSVRAGGNASSLVAQQLPIPHPLDYDWRFDSQTIQYLLGFIEKTAQEEDPIAMLGTPTLFVAAHEESVKNRIRLYDSNSSLVSSIRHWIPQADIVHSNLLEEFSVGTDSFSIVVADPPWYSDYTRSFLWAARRLCGKGGKVLLSMPPIGTRPGIESERESLIDWGKRHELHLERVLPGALRYISPPFERNALRAANVSLPHYAWRRGDLAIFSIPQLTCEFPHPAGELARPVWNEETVKGVRIKLRKRVSPNLENPALVSIVSGDILDSVSSRDHRIQDASVWTSGNRIFSCESLQTLQVIFQAINREVCPIENVAQFIGFSPGVEFKKLILSTSAKIHDLLDKEHSECGIII